jgi:hypothetical protein
LFQRKVTEQNHGRSYNAIVAEMKYTNCVQNFKGEISWTLVTLNKTENEMGDGSVLSRIFWKQVFRMRDYVIGLRFCLIAIFDICGAEPSV